MYTKKPRPPYRSATSEEISVLEHDTYRNNISDPVRALIPSAADFPHYEYVVVSSSSRDRSRYPNPADFVFHFDRKDIQQVELISGYVPAAVGHPFVYLDIEHMRHIEVPNGSQVFDLVPLKESRGFTQMDIEGPSPFRPLNPFRLKDARVRILVPDTLSVLQLTAEPEGSPIDPANQITFMLKFTRIVPKPLVSFDMR